MATSARKNRAVNAKTLAKALATYCAGKQFAVSFLGANEPVGCCASSQRSAGQADIEHSLMKVVLIFLFGMPTGAVDDTTCVIAL